MKIKISGRKISLGESLKTHVEERIEKGISKYVDRAIIAEVEFGKDGPFFTCDINVDEGQGNRIIVKAQGESEEIYAAFDQAADRIEKQLRRYKRRIKNHKKEPKDMELEEKLFAHATKFVMKEKEDEAEDQPLIIAEKPTKIETLTVSDAVMKMNLANLPALMFVNKKSGNLNVVYLRKDGNISWVDPALKSA